MAIISDCCDNTVTIKVIPRMKSEETRAAVRLLCVYTAGEITRLSDACGEGSACPSSRDPFMSRGKLWKAEQLDKAFFFLKMSLMFVALIWEVGAL